MGFHNIFVFHGLFESVFIEFNYIFRGTFRGDNSAGGAIPFIVVAEFAECRNVRQLGITLFIVTLGLNIVALYIVRKYREQYE